MRKEHKSHVVIILLMMLVILGVFVFVILNRPAGAAGAGITTYVPPASPSQGQPQSAATGSSQSIQASQTMISPSSNIEIDILIGFLILLALLFIWYVSIKIAKELKGKHNNS